jgi:TldD protein
VDYHTNREFATVLGEASRGSCRADGWGSLPMIRITNLSLMPGEWALPDLIADTDDGILICTNKSWSIDQMRYNFQFGCEIGWEIKNGKLGAMLKNCTYQGITPRFWGSCDAVCGPDDWTLWGVVNCGKGQPGQTARMSHGAAPARFRKVAVGIPRK